MKKIIFLLPLFLLFSCGANSTTVPTSPTATSSVSSEVPVETSSPITTTTYGSGKHTVQIFADFQCPACINFSHSILPLFESEAASGKVVIDYKQYPLTTIHKNAYRDALAALCANDVQKYGVYKTGLYALETQKAGATTTDSDRIALAQSV